MVNQKSASSLALAAWLLVSFVFIQTRPAFGLMELLGTKALTRASELAIVGRVEQTRPRWNSDRSRIFTEATVSVEQTVFGRAIEKQISVRYPGGKIGDLGMGVSDGPQLRTGERVLLFLKRTGTAPVPDARDGFEIVGAAQGKYSISRKGLARKKGFTFVVPPGGARDFDNNVPLHDLIEKIRSLDRSRAE